MANKSRDRSRPVRTISAQPAAGLPAVSEPPVRRWPHPVDGTSSGQLPASAQTDSTLHYIRCALSYQNQLLADIKALLEQLTQERTEDPSEK